MLDHSFNLHSAHNEIIKCNCIILWPISINQWVQDVTIQMVTGDRQCISQFVTFKLIGTSLIELLENSLEILRTINFHTNGIKNIIYHLPFKNVIE